MKRITITNPIYSDKDLRKLIIPIVIEQLLGILVGFFDTIMVSSGGETAVAGVSLVDTINILIIQVFVALANGGAVCVGHCIGQKDTKGGKKSAWQLILLLFTSSIALTVVFVAAHEFILNLAFGSVEKAVMDNCRSYLIITAVSICPLAVYNGCAGLFRAMGDSKTTMWISVLMNVINVIGNAIFIYIANMGVSGAALSTSISRTVAAVIIFIMMFDTKRLINFRGFVTWRPNWGRIKKILYIGVPNGVESSMFQLGKLLMMSLVATFSTSAVTANTISNTICSFNVLPGGAIGGAMMAVTAVCIGAGEYDQVRYYTRKLMTKAMIYIAILSAILLLITPYVIAPFGTTPVTSELAVTVIRYHAVMAVGFWAISFALPNVLRAAGDVLWTMIIAIFSMWVFRIVSAYAIEGYFHVGLMSVWIAMTIDWVFRAIMYYLRFKSGKWQTVMQHKRQSK